MDSAGDYDIEKALPSSSRSCVLRARRRSDGTSVVLKRYHPDDSGRPSSCARAEFESLRAAAGPGVVAALELLEDEASPTLVLEHAPGVGLDEWIARGLPSEHALLRVALQLARALECVHRAQRVHCDVNPTNVVVDPDTLEARLIDFASVHALAVGPGGHVDPAHARRARGRAAYMAPEQTGRMARGIDARSDLYSLGAVLYFVGTGRPPFDLHDPLALMHAHLARVPRSPRELRPELSPAVARIVLKLLEKDPERRYQTAVALAHDLAAFEADHRALGRVEDGRRLGVLDVPRQQLFPKRLFGREREVAALLAAYARARSGATELVLLSGAAGVGKSSLVDALRRTAVETGGYVCTGRFDPSRRQTPYSAWVGALDSFIQQVLCEDAARLAEWRGTLRQGLGDLAGVVVELVPDLAVIVGATEPPVPLGPRSARTRLALALQRLVEACARPEHPLVLVLEDLQWVDGASRDLIADLLRSRLTSLLLLGSVERALDAEPAAAELAAGWRAVAAGSVHELDLEPLTPEAVTDLLAEALERTQAQVASLATCMSLKTGGNPLLIRELMAGLQAEGAFRFAPEVGWEWDMEAISAAPIPDGAVPLMIARLEQLDPDARSLLELASCLGDTLELERLAELSSRDRSTLHGDLARLAESGAIVPSRRGYRFAHERIRDAAQSLLGETGRARVHLEIARRQARELRSEDARVSELAEHFGQAAAVLEEGDRPLALAAQLRAGSQAIESGAIDAAVAYLAAGRELFRESDWTSDPHAAFTLFVRSIDAAEQTRDLELAATLLDRLETRPLAPIELARVRALRVRVVGLRDLEQATALAFDYLERFGVRWPRSPSRLRMWLVTRHTDWVLRGSLERRFARPETLEPDRTAPLRFMEEIAPLLLLTPGPIVGLSVMYRLRMTSRLGTSRSPALMLAAFAAMRIEFLGHYRGMRRYADAAAYWIAQRPDPISVRAEASLLMFVRPWTQPRRSLAHPLLKVAERLHEHGEVLYATHVLMSQHACMALSGEPLPELRRNLSRFARWQHWRGVRALGSVHDHTYALLERETPSEIDWDAEAGAVERRLDRIGLIARIHWIAVLTLFGQYERGFASCARTRAEELTRTPIAALDLWLYEGICAAALAVTQLGSARRRLQRRAIACTRELARVVRFTPDAAHMADLLSAEVARLRRRPRTAARAYARAAARAQDRGFRHHAALAHERRAGLMHRGRHASHAGTALVHAIALYAEWGATAKVRSLEPQSRVGRGIS